MNRLSNIFFIPIAALVISLGAVAQDAPLPSVASAVQPRLGGVLAQVRGEIVAEAKIDAEGRVESVAILSSFMEEGTTRWSYKRLEKAALDAYARWRFEPARIDGAPAPSVTRQTFRFNGGVLAVGKNEIQASGRLKSVHAMANPASRSGHALLLASIDAGGRVTHVETKVASDAGLAAQAESSVKRWRFRPAHANGQPQPETVWVPFVLGSR